MRLGEITAIKVSDYRREKDEVKLWRTKNGDERSVPLSTRAKELLDKLVLGKGRDDQIFPFSSEVLGTFFRRVRGVLGFTDLHFHDMRHEAITRMAEKFDNALQLSQVSGHRDMKHLARYYNPSASELVARLG